MTAEDVARLFAVDGEPVEIAGPLTGNINDTYVATFRTDVSEKRILLQRLNRRVFPSPAAVMHNVRTVTDHIRRHIDSERAAPEFAWRVPCVIPARDGGDLVIDSDGDAWRALSFIDGARSFECVQGAEHAVEIGRVLGHFHRCVEDLPVDRLCVTLPGFHDTPRYLAEYDGILCSDVGRERLRGLSAAEDYRAFIDVRRGPATLLMDAYGRGDLPMRVTHGDPKVDNVMIEEGSGRGLCLVDLDTVQPGLLPVDVGDCLRSACNRSGEDPSEPSGVTFDSSLCGAITTGYMGQVGHMLSAAERHYLYDSVRLLTFELGVRFFGDYVAGNRYFKVGDDRLNLRRARVQFSLCESIEAQEATIRKILGP